MDYLFDGILLYRSEDGTIHILEAGAEDTVTLTPVLNRILHLLVARQGELITKEEFLSQVWDNYGKTGSSHTLNQYLSTLRGIFSKHLNKKAIITIPREGYLFSPEVNVVIQPHALAETQPQRETGPTVSTPAPLQDPRAATLLPWLKKYLPYYLLLLGATIASTLYGTRHYSPDSHASYALIGKIESCPVFSLALKNDAVHDPAALSQVTDMAKENNLTCAEGIRFYYYRNENSTTVEKGVYSMLARCRQTNSAPDECTTTRVSW